MRVRAGLALLLVAALPCRVAAHPMAPALLELREAADGTVAVRWKEPATRPAGAALTPVLPPDCPTATPPAATTAGDAVVVHWRIACGAAGLVGRAVGIDGLARAGTDALLRLVLADGRVVQRVLRAAAPSLVVPPRPSAWETWRDHARLGVEHILSGPDHLLFVFGLLLLVPATRTLAATVTAFTLGHSITLALAVLGFARVPADAVEVAIALSVLILAGELARAAPNASLLRRRPWTMALVFGLLHGLGFASALRVAGLPPADVPLALGAFNLGIEAGQLAFVVVVLALWATLRRLGVSPALGVRMPAYAMGSLAALWTWERVAALVWPGVPTW